MRILLFGEFSGLFANMKQGLESIGHEVFLVSDGNGYKNFPADFRYDAYKFNKSGRFKSIFCAANLWLHRKLLRGYDIVFFIDPSVLSRRRSINAPLYRYMIKHNRKSVLCGAGDNAIYTDFWYGSGTKVEHYIKGMYAANSRRRSQQFLNNEELKKWENELLNSVDEYIPILYEYAEPFRQYKSFGRTIRIPIPVSAVKYSPNIVKGKVVFMHGISTRPEAKGTNYILEAFDIMRKKYSDVAEFVVAKGLPFKDYMDLVANTNVILDCTNGYSYAMNVLFSLASGKIVMGGAEPEGNKELEIDGENPVINLKPDVNQICEKIEYVLANKDKIEEMGLKSRRFVEQFHNSVDIARQYENEFIKLLS